MARVAPPDRSKTLEQHYRDGTFLPGKHGHLLVQVGATVEQWRVRSVRQGGSMSPAEHFEAWVAEYVRHTVGRWHGKPFVFEPWQRELIGELLAVDKDGRRVIRQALIGLPRKNGKSSLLSALALYFASIEGEYAPDVIVAAGSRDQAAVVFDQARAFANSNPLIGLWFEQQRFIMKCKESDGLIRRVAADGRLQHGLNPSAVIVDELHSFSTPRQVELWAAMQTATGARELPLTCSITTAGYDRTTILGKLYKAAVELPQLEARNKDSLLVAKDLDSGFLFWWYTVPESVDIEDEAAWMRANPASWITAETLRQQLESPSMDQSSFERLHLNRWTTTRTAWLPAGCWDDMKDESAVPADGQEIFVGVDVGLVHDCTAVSIAWVRDDHVCVQSHVFSAVPDVPAHEYNESGRIDLAEVEDYIRHLAKRFTIVELVFDPRFFERSAQLLAGEGLTVAPVHQSSAAMSTAYQQFYASAREGRMRHDGDPVLGAHVAATSAKQTSRGWKIAKIDQSKRIDACVATVMAHWRAWRSVSEPGEEGFLIVV